MPLSQGLRAKVEPLGRAKSEVLDEDVGALDETTQYLLGVLLLEVEGEGLLGAVEPDEVAREALDGTVVGSSEVSHLGALDLYYSGAEVGELARGEGRGDRLLQKDDRDAFEREHP
jgi:hypothetical protein